MGEAENRTGFLSTISPYDKTASITEEKDVYDPKEWGTASGLLSRDTYLEAYYDYIIHVTDFENNVYDLMRAAVNYATDPSEQLIP